MGGIRQSFTDFFNLFIPHLQMTVMELEGLHYRALQADDLLRPRESAIAHANQLFNA